MQADVYSTAGEVVGTVELDETVWAIEPNIAVMHQALLRQQANARLGTHETKNRARVRGGGRKPYRQKGTGRARQGSIRAPQWKGGGVVWGPHPRKYTQAMPRKMRLVAVRSALSAKVRDERLTVIRDLAGIEPRTKAMKAVLANLAPARSTLIVVPSKEGMEAVYRSAGNLQGVWVIISGVLNVRDLLKYERVIVLEEALPDIERWLALPAEKRAPGRFRKLRLARLEQRQRRVFGRASAGGAQAPVVGEAA